MITRKSALRLRLIETLAFICPVLFFTSCSDDNTTVSAGTGRLSLNIDIDNTFYYPDGAVVGAPVFLLPEVEQAGVFMRSVAGAYSHVWPSFTDFPQEDIYYTGTYYLQAFYGYEQEGFDFPYYNAVENIDILPGRTQQTDMTLRPVSTANTVTFDAEMSACFKAVRAYLHADGGGYFGYDTACDDILYLLPGHTSVYLELTLADGREVGYKAFEIGKTESGVFYEYRFSLDCSGDDPVVTCTVGSESVSRTLDSAFVSALPPELTAYGWTPDEIYVLPEGEIPDEAVRADISSSAELSHLYFTVNSPYLNSVGVPRQADLLSLSAEEAEIFSAYGLKWSSSPRRAEIDLSAFMGNFVFLNEAQAISTIGLMAEDVDGRVGNPLMLTVETRPMEIVVDSVSSAMVGATTAVIRVATLADDFASHVAVELLDNGKWHPAEIVSVGEIADGIYDISFAIPPGSADLNARILYCQEVRGEVCISRFMPDFSLEFDAFATYARVKVIADTPELISAVANGLDIYLNGSRASVLYRDTEEGMVVITGLAPSTSYILTATMMRNPGKDDFTSPVRLSTESDPSLPNDEFEHRKEGVSYKNLPSGGRYSQTTVAIFNWQNHQTFSLQVPREWANTNAKTFSTRSSNHNTWYMQPSVYSVPGDTEDASFAVCLRSVAFDVDGAIIPDYTQTGQPYLQYSPIIPEIKSRAAGKLFLGSYSFNPLTMEETYDDIVDWRSRPMSLNGYYKYNPSQADTSDSGVAIIEVYGNIDGERRVIASATAYLPVANSYTAFKASLTYDYFGVKATGLKVMFASSAAIGTIAEESAAIATAPDPVKGESVGSTLWLDHVTLSY